jgi:hypothetical protein
MSGRSLSALPIASFAEYPHVRLPRFVAVPPPLARFASNEVEMTHLALDSRSNPARAALRLAVLMNEAAVKRTFDGKPRPLVARYEGVLPHLIRPPA